MAQKKVNTQRFDPYKNFKFRVKSNGKSNGVKSKGIHRHMHFGLGKAAARRDDRNLMLAAILRPPSKLPKEYDFDIKNPDIPTPMFGNDAYGDCVIAGRAHQTLRFEKLEQGSVINITDKDVVKEYLKESGGEDSGLVVLDSLKEWRKKGWHAAGRTYKIKAFAQINSKNNQEIKSAIYMDLGVGFGLSLPLSAQTQLQAGKRWDVVKGNSAKPNSWGGHYVYVSGYTTAGPVCVTWGRKQQMTWTFAKKYCDEAYAIIDATDSKKKIKGLKKPELDNYLKKLRYH